uniref:Uncharacterized protein n=1 Tax=Anguilla anguilla TaxID=7936 RepID=A0A0E9QFU0_ANGAN
MDGDGYLDICCPLLNICSGGIVFIASRLPRVSLWPAKQGRNYNSQEFGSQL